MSNATYELPQTEEVVIDGYRIDLSNGALGGQALIYDAGANIFKATTLQDAYGSLSGSFVVGQVAYAAGTQLLNGSNNFTFDGYNLSVAGDGYFTGRLILNGSTAAVSSSGTGAFRFNSGTNHLEFSENGGSWAQVGAGAITIGETIASGTNKSVLFIDSSTQLAQDNSNFNYDISTKKLTVGGHISVDGYTIDISGGAVNGQVLAYNGTSFIAQGSSGGMSGTLTSPKVPYATSSSTLADSGMAWDDTNKILTVTTITGNDGVQITDATRTIAVGVSSSSGGQLGTTSNHNLTFFTNNSSAQVTLTTGGNFGIGATPSYALHVVGDGYFTSRQVVNGSTAAVSPSGTGAIRFNSGTSHLEFSENGGSWTQFGGGSGTTFGASGQKLINIVPIIAFGANNATSVPSIVSAISFNPSDYTLTTGAGYDFSAQSYVLRIIAACGNATVTGHVKFRDITAGVDIKIFTITGSTTESKAEQILTVSSAGTNTIASADHLYELSIYVDSPSLGTDFIQLFTAELRIISTV